MPPEPMPSGITLLEKRPPFRNGHAAKLAFSQSPLAAVESPIHKLVTAVQTFIHFPDPGPLYALTGALVGAMLRGHPVWLMLIGPPSCGKSALLNALLCLPKVRPIDNVSGEAAFLSGTKQKERVKDATGGLLREIGDRGCLVSSDFTTTMLSQEDRKIRELMGVLRMLYDGRWGRDIGSDGGKSAMWSGRIGFLAGSTDAVDDQTAVGAEMGERCLSFRYPTSDGWAEGNRAAVNPDPETTKSGLDAAVIEFISEIGVDWDDPEPPRPLQRIEIDRFLLLAQLTARFRAVCKRDWRTRELISVQRPELPPRLMHSFAQLYRGMERAGCTASESWNVCVKVAMDTMPDARRRTLTFASASSNPVRTNEVAELLRVSRTQGERILGDLAAQGVIWREPEGRWRPDEWVKERVRQL